MQIISKLPVNWLGFGQDRLGSPSLVAEEKRAIQTTRLEAATEFSQP
jgi:hypothetical protein